MSGFILSNATFVIQLFDICSLWSLYGEQDLVPAADYGVLGLPERRPHPACLPLSIQINLDGKAICRLNSKQNTNWCRTRGFTLWTPAYTPGDGQTSWVYPSIPVLHLYISCYLSDNKPVLSYLLLCLLPLWWPRSGCTLTPTLTRRQPSALVALSSAFVSDFLFQVLQCTLHWLQHSLHFLLAISFRNQQFSQIHFSVGSEPRTTTMPDFEHVTHRS